MIRRLFLAAVVALAVAGAGKPQSRGRDAASEARVSEVAMADSIWISADGNLNAAGSWSPSGVPGAAGNIAFNGSSNIDVLSGLSALAGVDLSRLWTQPDYEGNIGAPGSPLNGAFNRFIHQGAGSIWWTPEAHASQSWIVVDSPNQQDAMTIVPTIVGTHHMFCENGGVNILDGAGAFGTFYVGSKRSNSLPVVTIGTGVTATTYVQRSGIVTTKSSLGSQPCVIDGGTFIVDSSVTAAWGTTIVIAGGTVQLNGTGGNGLVVVSSGTLDMSQDTRAKNIAVLVLMDGCNYITHNNITETLLIDLRGTVPVLP